MSEELEAVARRLGLDLDDPRQRAFAESQLHPVLDSGQLHAALVEAGVIRAGEKVRRIVIDAQFGHAVVLHVERVGDERMLQVVRKLEGIEVREVGRERIDVSTHGDPHRSLEVGRGWSEEALQAMAEGRQPLPDDLTPAEQEAIARLQAKRGRLICTCPGVPVPAHGPPPGWKHRDDCPLNLRITLQ